jgi:protoporphyrinogen/coproporphyrinogen III oxidase
VARTIVVGAGLAGLAAAHRLTALGHDVTALEARARPGGKHARVSLADGEYEAWPGWLPPRAPAFAELAAELGVEAELARTPQRWSLREALGRSPLAPLRLRRVAVLATWLGGALDPDTPWRDTRLDDRSAADFCRVYLGRRALAQLVEPWLEACFGLSAENTSRQLLFALLEPAGELGLDRLRGTGRLAEALAAKLGDLRCARRVARVARDGRSIELDDGARLDCDTVVLAVSAAEAGRLLGTRAPAEAVAFEQLRAQSALVLALATKTGFGPAEESLWFAARDGGELAAIHRSGPRLLQLVARPGLFERHGHRPDPELAHFLLESAERELPGLADAVAGVRLHRFPASLPGFAVGHYRALARLLSDPTPSGVQLAGDWCAAPHVEGELASGLAAARLIANL